MAGGEGEAAGRGEGTKARVMELQRSGGDEARGASKSFDAQLGARQVKLSKILVANRGEIAIRIFRAAKELHLTTVAIFSKEDRLQVHRYKADESYPLLGTTPRSRTPTGVYLDIEGIIQIAKDNNVDAIHPGYGFLSENKDFSRRCAEEGIVFIGPDPAALDTFGDKTSARAVAVECGIPVIPGAGGAVEGTEEALEVSRSIGFPVMLKAAKGGGGKGMRVVRTEPELAESFQRASNEALTAFGDGRMFVEKFIDSPRHIEVQVLCDNHGGAVHLFERDCSIQRRHQKVVEVAPSVGLPEETKQKIYRDAVKIVDHVGYRSAGTVEFMVTPDGSHYFLEVNPRVQVEHTVTEEVTGVDIVQSQILIASGCTLAEIGIPSQDALKCSGFAIQGRVTSEDPENNFQPDSGRIESYRAPGGPGIRLDSAIVAGGYQLPYYDSLLCKVTAKSTSFEGAATKLEHALHEFRLRGIRTNIPFICNVLRHPTFLSGRASTHLIDDAPELFDFTVSMLDIPSKVMKYLANVTVNGGRHIGAKGQYPTNLPDPVVPQVPESARGEVRGGWRDVLQAEGPEGFARKVRQHKGLLLTDTTMRDAHQSLLATRLRTYDMAQAADYMGWAMQDMFSFEMWGGATFDVAMRFLHECPWKRLRLLRERIPNVPFQMLLRGVNAVGYTSYPDNVVKSFVKEAKEEGIDIFRVFDSLNYVENLYFGIDAVLEAGGVAEGTICYTGDICDPSRDKYDLEYFLDLARKLISRGIHILGIKDMAGLLKPQSARMLVSALREEFPDLPIHVHTHDTAGLGVATMLAAAEAGADIVDTASDSMSGMTSQPSMGALVNALQGSALDTGLDNGKLLQMSSYWEQVRRQYAQFESGMMSGNSDVYRHEMPGGQYTNLKFQAFENGLVEDWERVKEAYREGNNLLGDIVKVTPSSKVVGDLAQFMVQNKLDEHSLLAQADALDFPQSVVEYFQGYLGQPPGGFPEPLRTKVLKGKPTMTGRPGASLPPMDFSRHEIEISQHYGRSYADTPNVLSSALYPKVFDKYLQFTKTYHDMTILPTKAFLRPLETDEEIVLDLNKGNKATITFKAVGELQQNGCREVFFEQNGIPRVILILEESKEAGEERKKTTKEKATSEKGSVGAPMAGQVIDVNVTSGQDIQAGAPLLVLSAMKMETTVSAPCSGRVAHVAIEIGDSISIGDLLVNIADPNAAPL